MIYPDRSASGTELATLGLTPAMIEFILDDPVDDGVALVAKAPSQEYDRPQWDAGLVDISLSALELSALNRLPANRVVADRLQRFCDTAARPYQMAALAEMAARAEVFDYRGTIQAALDRATSTEDERAAW